MAFTSAGRSSHLSLGLALLFAGVLTQAAPSRAVVFTTTLGPEAAGASGTGTAQVSIDELTNQMRVEVSFAGLSGITTVAHIHGPTSTPGTGTAGVMTSTPSFPLFPVGVQSGSYDSIFDLLSASTYRSGFLTSQGSIVAARNTLLSSLNSRTAYLNVHSSTFQSGEIRGFFQVPAPLPILGAATGLAWCRRLRRRVKAAI